LGVTHGAVSRQIKQLEIELGLPLFDREGRSLQLNARGSRLKSTISKALDDISEGLRQLSPDILAGPLMVACTPSMAANWLTDFVRSFSDRYPEIEVHLTMIQPTQRVLPSEFDVAFCFGEPESAGNEVELLYSENFFPVVSPRLLAKSPRVEKPVDLLGLPLIHDRIDHWPKWLRSVSLKQEQATRNVFVQEAHLSLHGARAGMGVALCDMLEVREDLESGTLVKPFNDSIPANHSVYLVVQSARADDIRVGAFCDWIREAIGDMVRPVDRRPIAESR
jgi:LysR family glycine cleavage system transcriptional activator